MKVFHVATKGLGPVLALILGSVGLLSSGCAPAGPTVYRTAQGLGEFEEHEIDKELAELDLDESQFTVSKVARDRLRGRVIEDYSIASANVWGSVNLEHLIDGNFREVRNVADGAGALNGIFNLTIDTPDVKLIRGRIATFYVAFLTEDSYCGFFVGQFQNQVFWLNGYLCRRGSLTEKVKAEHRTHVENFLFRMEKH